MKILFEKFNDSKLLPKNSDLIALVETHINSDYWYHYGFFQGGEAMFEDWYKKYQENEDCCCVDAIIYPIYYCYRHAIEVYIKKLLLTLDVKFEANHNIDDLYGALIKKLDISIVSAEQKEVELLIGVLHKVDPSFTRFRYDIKKNGDPCADKLKIDLIGMVNGFRKGYGFFDKIWQDKFKNDKQFINRHYKKFEGKINVPDSVNQ